MSVDKFIRAVGPVVAMAMAAAASASRDGHRGGFGGKGGVPLSQLDLSGDAPDTITLASPDIVHIVRGADFAIAIEGEPEARERMRFRVEGGTLTVMRSDDSSVYGPRDQAIVSITMPAPAKLVIAGAGAVHSDTLASDAEIVIAGAGSISTPAVAVESLDVTLAGAGTYKASGSAERLDLRIAGAGRVKMAALNAEKATVRLAGAGSAAFSSDGKVKARIMGAGHVTVWGGAECTVSGLGSGSLTCKRSGSPDAQG